MQKCQRHSEIPRHNLLSSPTHPSFAPNLSSTPPPITPQRITLRPDSKWVTSDRSHWSAGWERSPSDKREHVSVLGQALTCLTPSFAMHPQNRRPFVKLWVGGKTWKDFGYLGFLSEIYIKSGCSRIADSAPLFFCRQNLKTFVSLWRSSRKATFVLVCVRLDSLCVQRTSKQGQPGCEMPLMDHMESQAAFCTFAIVHSGNANHISVELFRIPFEIVQDGGCASHHIDRWIWQCSVAHVCQNKKRIGSWTLEVLSRSLKCFSALGCPTVFPVYLFYWTGEHKEWVCLFYSKHINSTVHSIPTHLSAPWQQQESKSRAVQSKKKTRTKNRVRLDVWTTLTDFSLLQVFYNFFSILFFHHF